MSVRVGVAEFLELRLVLYYITVAGQVCRCWLKVRVSEVFTRDVCVFIAKDYFVVENV